MKRAILVSSLLLAIAMGVAVLAGAGLVGGPYAIAPLDVNGGGEYAEGGPYAILGSVAQAGGIGEAVGGQYELVAGFLAQLPFMQTKVSASREWMYENDGGRTQNRNTVTFTARVEEDTSGSDYYIYDWSSHVHPVTGVPLVLVSGGGPNDPTATYAAPQVPSAARSAYVVTCRVVGMTQAGAETLETTNDASVAVHLLGDANGDYAVTVTDFSIWKTQNGLTGPGLTADFNGDEKVTAVDFSLWKVNNGRTVP